MPKSPAEMIEAISRNIPARTGKSVDEWVRLVQAEGPPVLKDRIEWLRKHHHMGSVTAKVIADRASGGNWAHTYVDSAALVDALYSGSRQHLRPLYEAIVTMALTIGKDVAVSERKTYTSLIRHRQFAVIKPSSKQRIDVGLALLGTPPSGRLQLRSGVGSDRMTHAVSVTNLAQIDAELKKWLNLAYERDAS